jgi:hypothetical protein
MKRLRTLRKNETVQLKKLAAAANSLDQSIDALEGLARTLRIVDPLLGPLLFGARLSAIDPAQLPEPRPTIPFGVILVELGKYAVALQHSRNLLHSEQVGRAPTRALTRNLLLSILFEGFMSCAGEPHWLEVSDIINAAYYAHRIENNDMSEAVAQRLWSRHRPR